jgi:EAL domain-containing protein (putative c-di-GMP-specific phosphodiesterase class I)
MAAESAEWTDPVAYLQRALAQNQFELVCQPIAALSGIMVYPMAEVLVRLREEETALLPPGDFLPVLEHYGMMPELDRWVLREVLRRLSTGPEIPRFSINLSRQTIADHAFPDFFADAVDASDVPADCIVFEIEEHDAAAAPSAVRRLCAAVGSLGAGVLIDGFGRGEAKLAALGVPCVQFIKIHGSLTRNIATDQDALQKVMTLQRITNDLGVAAIAECVECEDVLAKLRAIKVRYAQGFGVCRPQSIDLVAELPAMRYGERRAAQPAPVQARLDLTNSTQEARWAN